MNLLSVENLEGGREPPDENLKGGREPPEPISTKCLAIGLLIKIAAIALAVWLVFTFFLGVTINHGNNMHPAVNDGDLVVSLKLQRPYAFLPSIETKSKLSQSIGG